MAQASNPPAETQKLQPLTVTGSRNQSPRHGDARPRHGADSGRAPRPALKQQHVHLAGGLGQFVRVGHLVRDSSQPRQQQHLSVINSRRVMRSGADAIKGFQPVIDYPQIPTAAIESREIIKDDAAGIYSSDAVAGVINIQSKRAASVSPPSCQSETYSSAKPSPCPARASGGLISLARSPGMSAARSMTMISRQALGRLPFREDHPANRNR